MVIIVPENAPSGPVYVYANDQKAQAVDVRVQYPFLSGLLKIGESSSAGGTITNQDLGYEFSSGVAGYITQIGLFVVEPGTFAVTLWDIDNREELISYLITPSVISSEYLNYEAVALFRLEADKPYRITMSRPIPGNFLYSCTASASYRDLTFHGAYRKDAFFPETPKTLFFGIDLVFLPDN